MTKEEEQQTTPKQLKHKQTKKKKRATQDPLECSERCADEELWVTLRSLQVRTWLVLPEEEAAGRRPEPERRPPPPEPERPTGPRQAGEAQRHHRTPTGGPDASPC